jgi:hypothetical protein
MLKFVVLATTLPILLVHAYKDKTTDEEYNQLIPLSEVPIGCGKPKDDFGLVDGKLEKCSRFLSEVGDNQEDTNYEKYKCKHLRGLLSQICNNCQIL